MMSSESYNMNMKTSDVYAQLLEKARWSHAHGRSVFHVLQEDIDAARLFSYAYRSQAIGAFHATRLAIETAERKASASIKCWLEQARTLLEQLETKAGEPVPRDFRALVSTLYDYHQWIDKVISRLERASARSRASKLENVLELFIKIIEPIATCNAIYVARDLVAPEQGAFIVPNLGISIVPVIYGDWHSWNAAFLPAGKTGVPVHRHQMGAEIHLGYSPVKGRSILAGNFAEISEGYAMPIPPMTDHGFLNTSGRDHIVPFIFGSLSMGGWGVFFDVEARSDRKLRRRGRPLQSAAMNHSVFLEKAIQNASSRATYPRKLLVPRERAGSREIGGLELGLNRVCGEINLASDHFRIISMQSGTGRLRIGNAQIVVSKHDHFGVPTQMACTLTQIGSHPLIFLDAMILPIN